MPHDSSTVTRGPFADVAPALDELTQEVLFGQVWERPGLSKRDRSLITVAALITGYRTNELPFHLKRALENGVTRDERRGDHPSRVLRRLAAGEHSHRNRPAGVRR
jgi:alkylhydroperoxidase/carboxymuconolactone decarboxylase family protein YurZ